MYAFLTQSELVQDDQFAQVCDKTNEVEYNPD